MNFREGGRTVGAGVVSKSKVDKNQAFIEEKASANIVADAFYCTRINDWL